MSESCSLKAKRIFNSVIGARNYCNKIAGLNYKFSQTEADAVMLKISKYGGKFIAKEYSCVWTSGSGNSSSGKYTKVTFSWEK